mmetsp:Transcript_4774/g.11537  ORF Transcript_4774/g.11537 Transcript_4774/m.11537 type:complete len:250 (-) Transcript_4774:884-1633(-)
MSTRRLEDRKYTTKGLSCLFLERSQSDICTFASTKPSGSGSQAISIFASCTSAGKSCLEGCLHSPSTKRMSLHSGMFGMLQLKQVLFSASQLRSNMLERNSSSEALLLNTITTSVGEQHKSPSKKSYSSPISWRSTIGVGLAPASLPRWCLQVSTSASCCIQPLVALPPRCFFRTSRNSAACNGVSHTSLPGFSTCPFSPKPVPKATSLNLRTSAAAPSTCEASSANTLSSFVSGNSAKSITMSSGLCL